MLHGGRPGPDGRLLVTDATSGSLIVVDPASGRHATKGVTCPSRWFLRGTAICGEHLVLLRSEVVPSRQRVVSRTEEDDPPPGARFGFSVLDPVMLAVESEIDVVVPGAPSGSVVYAAT